MQLHLFHPHLPELTRIAALREVVAEARRTSPDFTRNARDRRVGNGFPHFQFDAARAEVDSEFGHQLTAHQREVESMAIYIDCNYDVWDAWVDWNDARTDYKLVVILIGGQPITFTDDHLALHTIHRLVGHRRFVCQCDDCTRPVPGQEPF